MLKYAPRCKDCDCVLWSDYARKLGICPECEGQDEDEKLNLEDEIEKLFENNAWRAFLLLYTEHIESKHNQGVTTMYAHYVATKTVKYVMITRTRQPYSDGAIRVFVKGKAEARKFAAQHGAECWNF